MLPSFGVVGNYQPQFIEPSDEWREVRFVVHSRFIHVVQYLLRNQAQCIGRNWEVSLERQRAERSRADLLLTRIEATCEYVAGHSLVLPIVKKNRLKRLNTSASVVSRRLLCVVLSSRTSLSFVTVPRPTIGMVVGAIGWDIPTLFYNSLIQGIYVCCFDILSPVLLERSETISDARLEPIRSGKLRDGTQSRT
jgi:hypothetical protein